MGVTNKGKSEHLGIVYRGATPPSNFYMALVTEAHPPSATTNTLGDLTEIPAGNGYTAGGISLNRDATDFDVLTEDDVNDRALVQIRDIAWTATGGVLPASGTGARWAVLTDDHATLASRKIYDSFDLVSNRIVSATQIITLVDCEIRANEG